MPIFLTDAWFDEVDRLTEEAGDLNLPHHLQTLSVNFHVEQDNGQMIYLNLAQGRIYRGLNDQAKTTLILSQSILRKVFFEFDTAAAMSAFMSGQIKIQGDMMQLMALQMAKPSTEQKLLYKKILDISS